MPRAYRNGGENADPDDSGSGTGPSMADDACALELQFAELILEGKEGLLLSRCVSFVVRVNPRWSESRV